MLGYTLQPERPKLTFGNLKPSPAPVVAPTNFDFTPYAIQGATRPDSFTGMRPEMQQGLAAMLQAAEAELGGGLQVYSGYRSPELQAELYRDAVRKYGSEAAARKWVAPPGRSKHNSGEAADLKWNGVRIDQAPPEIRNWVTQNAGRFGLDVPMSWEPWQVELKGARGSKAPAAGNQLAAGIVQAAGALGIDPVDLATVISYETAGTFDPTKRGPTTQWGQHRGLIQFGEPQAQQYGVDWRDPINSQLGENGAIVNYLRQAGVKPGMGLLDVYSAVNAGQVGLYNRTDANNGGAPGTVLDKVNNQMQDHRRKAQMMLAGAAPTMAPPPPGFETKYQGVGFQGAAQPQAMPQFSTQGPAPQAMPAQMSGMDANLPELPPEFRPRRSSGEIMGFLNQHGQSLAPWQREFAMKQLQMARQYEDPWGRLELRKRYAEATGWKPQQAAQPEIKQLSDGFYYYIDPNGQEPPRRVNPDIEAGAGGGQAGFGLTPVYGTDKDGNRVILQLGKDGTAVATQMPEGVTVAEQIDRVDAGTHWVLVDKITGQQLGRIEKNAEEAAEQSARGAATGKAQAAKAAGAGSVISTAQETARLIDEVLSSPSLDSVVGKFQGRLNPEGFSGLFMSQDQISTAIRIKQLESRAFLEAFESLKGGGAITEKEGDAARAAIARLQRVQSEQDFREALGELKALADLAVSNAQKTAGTVTTDTPTATSGGWSGPSAEQAAQMTAEQAASFVGQYEGRMTEIPPDILRALIARMQDGRN